MNDPWVNMLEEWKAKMAKDGKPLANFSAVQSRPELDGGVNPRYQYNAKSDQSSNVSTNVGEFSKLDNELSDLKKELEVAKLRAEIMKLDNSTVGENKPGLVVPQDAQPHADITAKEAGAVNPAATDGASPTSSVKDAASSVEDLLKGIADMHKRAIAAMNDYKASVSGTESTSPSTLKEEMSAGDILNKLELMEPHEKLAFYKSNRHLVGAALSYQCSNPKR